MARNRTRRYISTPKDNGPTTHSTNGIREEKKEAKMDQNEIPTDGTTFMIPTLEVGADMVSTMTEFQLIIILGNQSDLYTDPH